MSIWRPTTEPCRVEIRGKPIFTSTSRRVTFPVTVGGQPFTWDMSVSHFKEIQAVQQHYDLESGRFDLEVSFEDTPRRRLQVVAVPRHIVIWCDIEGHSGECFASFATRAEALRFGQGWVDNMNDEARSRGEQGTYTYTVREAS